MNSHHRRSGYGQRRLKGQTLQLAPALIAIVIIAAVGVIALLIMKMTSHSDPWLLDHLNTLQPETTSPEAIINLSIDDHLNDQVLDPLDLYPDATLAWPAVGIALAMIGLNVLVIWRLRVGASLPGLCRRAFRCLRVRWISRQDYRRSVKTSTRAVHFSASASPITIQRPPDPFDLAQQLIAGARRMSPYRQLRVPTGTWEAGLALHTGPMRRLNEDYALIFQVDDWLVAALADGCGGIPFGQQAAYAAVTGAASSVIRQLAWLSGPQTAVTDVETVALRAIYEACDAIGDRADKQHVDPTRSMRCTLIVAVISKQQISYAHIGDGGGFVFHCDDGALEPFVNPQKASTHLNVLEASLGPKIEGEPRSGTLERRRGDLIWLCSDGIADRTDPTLLSCDLVQTAIVHGGDLTSVAQAFLDQFASWRDEDGLIFDDNMSLILIGDEAIAGMPVCANERRDPDPTVHDAMAQAVPCGKGI